MREICAHNESAMRLAALVVCGILATSLPAGERKVLTIALDGLRPDALLAANAPNVDSLVNGTFFGTSGPSGIFPMNAQARSEEHTSELQSLRHLVCRLL